MSLPSFLTLLFEHGRVRVPEYGPISDEEISEARSALVEFEAGYRQTLPGEAPEFLVETACWSAVVMYRACQCQVYRELEVERALPALKSLLAERRQAAHHYSADVLFRLLPDVWRLSRDVASADPLVKYLHELAAFWPLSSVGMPEASTQHVDEMVGDPCLLAVYVDRILERKDRSRLGDPRVRDAVRKAIGMFPELSPEMAKEVDGVRAS